MKKGMTKSITLFVVITMLMQLFALTNVMAASTVTLNSPVVNYSNGRFVSSGTLEGGTGDAVVLIAAYEGSKLSAVEKQDVSFKNGEADYNLAVTAPISSKVLLFFWNGFTDCEPLREAYNPLVVSATSKANGVSLAWSKIANADSYEVYRDDEKIATVAGNAYDDIYFDTIEEIATPYVDPNESHTYYVKANNVESTPVASTANVGLIKYITFDNATYTEEGINAGANGLNVSVKNGTSALALYTVRERKDTDAAEYTTKYISTQTYRAYNEPFVGNFGGQNALGLIRYQYRSYVNGVLTLQAAQPTRPIIDMTGFEAQDNYTIIMNANIMADSFTVAGVEKENKDNFSDKAITDNKVYVVGGEEITAANGVFNPGANKNKFTTYIYDMNTAFNGLYGDMRFSNTSTAVDETAAIRSIGIVKKADFIMPRERTAEDVKIVATSKANGVSLVWTNVASADSYEVYRDDEKIATVTENAYNDIYFDTIEEIATPYVDPNESHTYYIKANGIASTPVASTANVGLIKYISFDNATYSADGINAGANGLFVATKDATDADLALYSLRAKRATDSADYTSKYISTMTYRKWNEVYVGDFGGQNALGLVSYQYKKYVNGVLTLDAVQPTRPILNMNGFESQDTYTIIMNANVMVDNFTVAGVETDNTKDSFADKNIVNNIVTVLGGEAITASNGAFNPGVNKNKFVTYIYDMNTAFNGSYGDMRFSNTSTTADETAAIRSMAVVKKSDFIMPKERTAADVKVTAEAKANGVSLSWNSLATVNSYEVYRDGEKIATVSENKYDDVYYDAVHEVANPYVDTKVNHTYYVKANGGNSNTVTATADLSLIKYITFDNATYTEDGINAGANGISVATKDAGGNDLLLYPIYKRSASTSEIYTSTYISRETYRKYNEAYVGNFGGQTALGLVKYQYNKKNNDGSSTVTTEATRPVLDITGFEAQDTYTVILNANIMADSFTVAGIETDSTKDSFGDKNIVNNTVTVLGGEAITASNGAFNPGVNKNKFATYIYDVNTRFNGLYGDMRFSNTSTTADETAAIRSMAVVKKADFIR